MCKQVIKIVAAIKAPLYIKFVINKTFFCHQKTMKFIPRSVINIFVPSGLVTIAFVLANSRLKVLNFAVFATLDL